MPAQILALDFDGVICDSAGECLFTSYSFCGPFFGLAAAHFPEEIPPDLQREFYRMRPFIRDGKDYVLILYFIVHRIPIEGQDDFDRCSREYLSPVCQEVGAADAKELEELFQQARRGIRARDKSAWLSLNPLYRDLEIGLTACQEHFDRIYVTTSKPTDAAIEILSHHRIPLPKENVYGYDRVLKQRGKNGHLSKVRELTGAPFKAIHLVDDQVSHLKAALELGANCYHARWGYTSEQQQEEAGAADITSLEQKAMSGWMQALLGKS